MTQYISNLIYTSSNNGNTNKYNLKDKTLRKFININPEIGAALAFYREAKRGFGSNYSTLNSFQTSAAAIKDVLPHWKICT